MKYFEAYKKDKYQTDMVVIREIWDNFKKKNKDKLNNSKLSKVLAMPPLEVKF